MFRTFVENMFPRKEYYDNVQERIIWLCHWGQAINVCCITGATLLSASLANILALIFGVFVLNMAASDQIAYFKNKENDDAQS